MQDSSQIWISYTVKQLVFYVHKEASQKCASRNEDIGRKNCTDSIMSLPNYTTDCPNIGDSDTYNYRTSADIMRHYKFFFVS